MEESSQRPTEADIVQILRSELEFAHRQLEARNVAESELRRLMLADKQELQERQRELTELRQRMCLLEALPQYEPEEMPAVTKAEEEPPRGFWLLHSGKR